MCSLNSLLIEAKQKKQLVFSTFVLGNQYPNNVCVLRNGSIIIVKDIVEFPTGSGTYTLVGVKFRSLENAFVKPYVSSHFKTYLASNVSSIDEWDFTSIQGKMEAIPYKFVATKNVEFPVIDSPRSKQKWFVVPIHHTFQE